MTATNLHFLEKLEDIIVARRASPAAGSYTTELFTGGTQRIAQKVGEEAIEVALAASAGERRETVAEAADLLYHLLVLLADQEIALRQVVQELQSRHKT